MADVVARRQPGGRVVIAETLAEPFPHGREHLVALVVLVHPHPALQPLRAFLAVRCADKGGRLDARRVPSDLFEGRANPLVDPAKAEVHQRIGLGVAADAEGLDQLLDTSRRVHRGLGGDDQVVALQLVAEELRVLLADLGALPQHGDPAVSVRLQPGRHHGRLVGQAAVGEGVRVVTHEAGGPTNRRGRHLEAFDLGQQRQAVVGGERADDAEHFGVVHAARGTP